MIRGVPLASVLLTAALIGTAALSLQARRAPIPEPDLLPRGWSELLPLPTDLVLRVSPNLRAAIVDAQPAMWSFQRPIPLPMDQLAAACTSGEESTEAYARWILGALDGAGVLVRARPGTVDTREPQVDATFATPTGSVYTAMSEAPPWLTATPALLFLNARRGRLDLVPLVGTPPVPDFDAARVVGRRPPGPLGLKSCAQFTFRTPSTRSAEPEATTQRPSGPTPPRWHVRARTTQARPEDGPRWVLLWASNGAASGLSWNCATEAQYLAENVTRPSIALAPAPGDLVVHVLRQSVPRMRRWSGRLHVHAAPSPTGPWARIDAAQAETQILERSWAERRMRLGVPLARPVQSSEYLRLSRVWEGEGGGALRGAPHRVATRQPTPVSVWHAPRPDTAWTTAQPDRIVLRGPMLTPGTTVTLIGPTAERTPTAWNLIGLETIELLLDETDLQHGELTLDVHTPGLDGAPVRLELQAGAGHP